MKTIRTVLLAGQRGSLLLILLIGTLSQFYVSLAYVLFVLALLMAVTTLVIFALMSTVLVYRSPIRHLLWLPLFVFVYRPLHSFVRFFGIITFVLDSGQDIGKRVVNQARVLVK